MRNRTDDTRAGEYARPVSYAERIAVTNRSRPSASMNFMFYIVLMLLILFVVFFAGRLTAANDTASLLNGKQTAAGDTVSVLNGKQPKAKDSLTSITMPDSGSPVVSLITLSELSLPRAISFVDSSSNVKKNIVAGSAKIISPRVRSVLSADTVIYEIEPKLPVDSVTLFVRHSQDAADTLGVFTSAPFRAVWNCANVPDQDQIHIQFGYVLYCPDSITITSPALPHRWALIRNKPIPASNKRYKIKQLPTSALSGFGVDCDLSKWADVESGQVGDIAQFKLLWSSAKLLFIAEVKDKFVTSGDVLELHLDFNRDRSVFAGINHRSLRFSPRARTNSFVVELNDSGFVRCDSINALISEDMARKYAVTKDGYVVEAAIPFSLISNLDFPKSKIGFDVTVTNVDGDGRDTSFHSWAGAERFTRYSPRVWGEARVIQSGFALKAVLIFVLIAGGAGIIAFFIHGLVGVSKEREQDEAEAGMFAQLSESVAAHIEKDHDTDDDDEDNA